jgi:galactokinase
MSVDIDALTRAFRETFGEQAALFAEAPGRVNLIGEHTDYNGGFVLPVAIDRTVVSAALPRDDRKVRVRALDLRQSDDFVLSNARRTGGDGWRNYVRGVSWALLDEFQRPHGADIAITGDVPRGAGLSSSAALELAAAGALIGGEPSQLDGTRLALLCQKAENRFVGVQCGVMDQLAAALCEPSHALLIDCESFDTEAVALPDIAIVIVDSKVRRNLSATAYNERRRECEESAKRLGVASLRDADDLAAAGALPDPLSKRARHVIGENLRVLQAVDALRGDDLETVGRLMLESHESLRDDFEVSCPELDLLVEIAISSPGAIGARMTGAGFGGCTVNLVEPEAVAAFSAKVRNEYKAKADIDADAYVCRPSAGLRVWVG